MAILWLGASTAFAAQQVAPGEASETAPEERRAASPPPSSPYEAYERGLYDQALQAFVDRQVEQPEDAELLLNIGSAHYQMRDYAAAEEAFVKAAMSGDDDVRAQALYDLGNTAYRQGKLEEAVERYQRVLDLRPDDEDAKFNLEFVRDEIRRRHEEAQKRQQQSPQEQQQQQPQEQSQEEQGDQQPHEEPAEQKGDQEQSEPQQAGAQQPEDRDGDGLPDREEQGAAAAAQQAAAAESLEGMTEEEAMRYLQALEEGRPDNRPARPGRPVRVEKDW
jgi:Ca-activated chloride channel family protein